MTIDGVVTFVASRLQQGGGLWRIDGGEVTLVDSMPTHGLVTDNVMVYRVVAVPDGRFALAMYDAKGLVNCVRLSPKFDQCAHVAIDGPRLIICTDRAAFVLDLSDMNSDLLWSVDSARTTRITAVGVVDSQPAAAIFDRGSNDDATGGIVELRSLRTKTIDNAMPTAFLVIDSHLVIGDSLGRRMLVCNAAGTVEREIPVNGLPTAIAAAGDYLSIALAADPSETTFSSEVITLDTKSWSAVSRHGNIPFAPNAIAVVSAPLAAGLAIGRRTNVTRVMQEDQLRMFRSLGIKPSRLWGSSAVPVSTSLRAEFDADIPSVAESLSRFFVKCEVTNRGDAIFTSAQPHPIEFYYRWLSTDGSPATVSSFRTPLPRALPPMESLSCAVLVATPERPGDYQFQLTLAQDGVGAFDDFDASSCVMKAISVRAPAPGSKS
jgi:hypothetical protein